MKTQEKEYQKKYNTEYYKKNKDKIKNQVKKYREDHKNEIKEYKKEYGLKNRDKINKQKKEYNSKHRDQYKKWCLDNKDKRKEYKKEYRKKNKPRISEYETEYRSKNKHKLAERNRENYIKNKDKKREYNKKYNLDNREKINERQNKNHKKRTLSDPIFKFKHNTRCLISTSFKRRGFKKNSHTFTILDCSFRDFHSHIVKQFKPGMTIENHGKVWHIDHIIPLSTATTYEEVIKLNHYTNLQPLWATTAIARANGDMISIGNLEKSDKYN